MEDITTIPTSELLADLRDGREDVNTCELAIGLGITTYSGGSVGERLLANYEINAKIEAELNRRGVAIP